MRLLHTSAGAMRKISQRFQGTKVFHGKGTPTIGIRRETVNAWERRAPLAPTHVKRLTKSGVNVLIQPSNRRAYPIQDYISAGAIVREDLSEAHIIMSVKSVPIDQLIPNKTYAFFSHTIKAQQDNMEMLDTILQRNIRLLDYEKIVDDKGKRLVMFGKWAGNAGFIDILHGIGLRLLALGHNTPFLHMGLAHNYNDSHMAINALRDIGYEIALDRMPRSLGPLIFVFTGSGNVSQGARELFEHLPHEYVDVATLPKVAQKGQLNKVYGCVVTRKDHFVPKHGGPFNKQEFEQFPDRYTSKFATEIAPYASVIINGVYWDAQSPRLITIPDAKNLLTPVQRYDTPGCPTLPHRLVALCDISADPGGSVEFMRECTTIDKPFAIYDADFNTSSDSFDAASGCLVCSIDNMPAQMPIEATEQFGNLLYPWLWDLLNTSNDQHFDRLQCRTEIKNAIITDQGKLTPNFEYIAQLRKDKASAASANSRVMGGTTDKRVLLLGAGMVSGPFADFYSKQKDVNLTVATESQRDGQRLCQSPNIQSVVVDVARESHTMERLIREHDLVVSLLPFNFHPLIAKMCISNQRDMVTSSYVSPELEALDKAAKDADVTIMNEAGLDPGIDHMLAMECFDDIREHGGRITSFESFCGGLPAPEWSDNALRYKFSWSPKGVLTALMNPAKYLKNGKIVEVPSGSVVDNLIDIDFMPGLNLIGFPNRDSTKYSDIYGLGNDCKTLIRGTLRYHGFVETVKALHSVGLLSGESTDSFTSNIGPDLTWKELIASLSNQKLDIFPDSLRHIIEEKVGEKGLSALENLGLFSDKVVDRHGTPIDTLAQYLAKILAFKDHESDLVVLNHDIGAQLPGGNSERHRISLVQYGNPNGFSAMARTVGYTTAIVSHMVLNNEIQRAGIQRPILKEVYRPALKRLRDFGIIPTHTITPM